jgi:GWxTD domain-containing protein
VASALPWLCCAALCGCSGEPAPTSAPAAEIVASPLRWLMLPEEAREARRLRSSREAVDFLEAFWQRRNPDPSRPTNEHARLFHERVEAADRLYAEDGTRGSLTDRGRALILLGPPPVLRYAQRRIPSWEPGRSLAPPAVRTRQVAVETWIYPSSELEPALATLLRSRPATAGGEPATLVFLAESPVHARLLEGETLLELAARALVRAGP